MKRTSYPAIDTGGLLAHVAVVYQTRSQGPVAERLCSDHPVRFDVTREPATGPEVDLLVAEGATAGGQPLCRDCASLWRDYQQARPPRPGGLRITGWRFDRHLATCDDPHGACDFGCSPGMLSPTWRVCLSTRCGQTFFCDYSVAADFPEWAGGDGWDGRGRLCPECREAASARSGRTQEPSLLDLLGGES